MMDETRPFIGVSSYPLAKPYREPPTACTEAVPPLQLVLVPTGLCVELTKADQLVGRHSSADVRLPLADVSRRHCRIVHIDGMWNIIDLDSMNGVFVNNRRIRQTRLQAGDHIRVGSCIFQVRLPEAATLLEPRRAS